MSKELISIVEAAEKGITLLKLPEWKMKGDHLKIDIISNNKPGPWMHMFSPFNKKCNGRDPVDLLSIQLGDLNKKEWLIYAGPLPESSEYKNVEEFKEELLDFSNDLKSKEQSAKIRID